jgi:DNA excision repair protein ERCC-3
MDLTKGGYLANVQVVEVWCPMTGPYLEEYLASDTKDKRMALSVMNPVKAWAASWLIQEHLKRQDDKIIVFSDSRFALERYARAFKQAMIHGDTPMADREAILAAFRETSDVRVLFLSKVGDVALDVPDANVIIQISSHYGSRMQEAQRMGRILRKKQTAKAASRNHAFFYTLLSTDTEEVAWSLRRRRYLVDQGYAYKVLTAFPGLSTKEELRAKSGFLSREDEQREALLEILRSNVEELDERESRQAAKLAGGKSISSKSGGSGSRFVARRASDVGSGPASMAELSGGTGLRYIEYRAAERTTRFPTSGTVPIRRPKGPQYE